MANGSTTAPGLSFPRETFAKLTPRPFLHAHLKRQDAVRPNGRTPHQPRKPTINTGSLSHSNGSAVVRVGDTAIVCGVRGEILLSSDIPDPPKDDSDEDNLIERLGLLIPNLELSTGCSPAHLPGNPPSSVAQTLSYRLLSLLHTSQLIAPEDLCVKYVEPQTDDSLPDEEPTVVTKAYWTLYVDILCIALDGNVFDAAWTAILAALQDTVLPRAWWEPDREMVLCSPLVADSQRLRLRDMPIASSFAVFSTASPLKQRAEAESWVLADPDAFEEDVCKETLTVITVSTGNGKGSILRLEKSGGSVIDREAMTECVSLVEERRLEMQTVLKRK